MKRSDRDSYAIVTGAGSGLGRCFALELASRKINTILIDLPSSETRQVADKAKAQGTESIVIEADLTDSMSLAYACETIRKNFNVNILINNAGCGGTRRFLDCPEEYLDRIVKLNILAVTRLTHRILPLLKKHGNSYILNVSSMAAFTPIGYKTVYPASKRFIYDFTRALQSEFNDSEVSFSVIHPGPMKTNPEITDRIEKQGRLGQIGLLSPEEVARRGINCMFRKKKVIIPGVMNKFSKFLTDIIPADIRLPVISSIIARELK